MGLKRCPKCARTFYTCKCEKPAPNPAILTYRDECEQLRRKVDVLRKALKSISAIEDRYNCGDWDEIEEARGIADKALALTEG